MKKIFIRRLLLLWLCLAPALIAHATTGKVRGKIVDKKTKEPIEAATVVDGQLGNTDLTDKGGNFTLTDVKGDTLYISMIGYEPRKVLVTRDNAMYIELDRAAISLKDVTITNAPTITTFKNLSYLDLNMQPAKSAQDLLRLVPGLFIAQHMGGGKAEQIFLRGFDADHGTDASIFVDGMPVNMVSQAHGQGYADLHFLIPEVVANYDFGKGPYYTDKGDFTTAGYVAYNTKNVLDQSMVKIEAGQYQTGRIVALINLLSDKAKQKGRSAYVAGEALYSNGGPFAVPEHFTRYSIFGKYNTKLGENNALSLSASTFTSQWLSSGEIPDRAVAEGYMANRFGTLDSFQGGYTSRTNVNLKLSTTLKNNWTMDNQLYYTYYYFNLVSNFTYYFYFPTTGDEFRQYEKRNMTGYNGKISKRSTAGNTSFITSAGIGFRYDDILPSELDHTERGDFIDYLQYGQTKELNANAWVDETIRTGKWLFNAGVRLDYFHFYYQNMSPASDSISSGLFTGISPNAQQAIVSPKVNVNYTFGPRLQAYAKAGKGFHSNDARVVIANKGYEVLPAAYGADLGLYWKPLPNLYINMAVWYLYLQQEFTFGSDLIDQPGGPVGLSGKTSRKGLDFSARYQITSWLFANLNINPAKPRYIDSPKGHDYVELAPTFTSTAALDFRFKNGINGGISYRYLHPRSANGDYSLTARGYFITDLAVNYTCKRYEVGIAIENLFNQQWDEAQFEYESQLKNEISSVDQVSYTPGVPFFAKLKLAVFF